MTINFDQDARVKVQIETNVEAIVSGIGAEHENTDNAPQVEVYRALRELAPADLEQKFSPLAIDYRAGLQLVVDGIAVDWKFDSVMIPEVGDERLSRKSLIHYSAEIPAASRVAIWSYAAKYGDAVVNFVTAGQTEKTTYWLVKGEPSPPYQLQSKNLARSWSDVAIDYTGLGYLHILPRGLDHILFVIGLFLLSRHFSPLLWQVTAFTLAHSITLALTIYGVISLSSSIVEPLIAISIAYVGIENILTRQLKPWRIIVVFVFGLLHGMGFAGVLTELGLPETEFVTALITFNIGVELGQLSVILLAFAAVFWLRQDERRYRNFVVIPGSVLIALMGLFWTWQRIAG
ncbi:MAG: HupE/UreJ family protein [Gammaproteobacteria bacterium]|nr:HupE/UreJ family protein [Gammaproteobacteria bacterium]